jgi:uncharacterized protein
MPGQFVVNTHDLGRRAGAMRELALTVTADEPLGSDVIAIPAGAPIELDLRLEAVSEGVLVTGTASATAVGECVRCLREVTEDVSVDLTELFAYPGSRTERSQAEDPDSDEDPLPVLDGDLLDLEATVTDALVPALPFQPLCAPDCAGLCSVCGVRLDDAEPGHAHEQLDPRWAALAGLASTESEEPEGGSR